MAEEHHQKSSHEFEPTVAGEGGSFEVRDRGLFDFLGKKEEKKPQDQEVIAAEFDQKVQVSEQHEPPRVEGSKIEEPKVEEEKKPSLLEKLHRSGSSSSSSSSDEEEGEGEEKKKKKKEKKGLKDKLKEKMAAEKAEEKLEDTEVPIEVVHQDPHQTEEKKGFLHKIKEKLPGQHKKADEVPSPTSPSPPPPPPPPVEHEAAPPSHEGEPKEKKGIFEKIKEKIPGYHSKAEEEKEKEKESASH